jgi:anti-anti-sigma factor
MASRQPDEVAWPCHALRVAVRSGTPSVIEIGGEIDVLSAPDLREELLHLIRRHGQQLALDLSGVTFMDCAGVGVLMATRRRAQLEGGWLRIVGASGPVRRTIQVLGLVDALALGPPTLPGPPVLAAPPSVSAGR